MASQTETAKTTSLTGTVHTAPEDIPVKDVARLMTARGIGSVVVVDKQAKPIGIITDRDITVRVTAAGLDSHATLVGALMSKPLVTITKSQDIGTAIGVMVLHGIRRLPIVDETGRLSSILTLDDILRFKLADPAELTQIVRTGPQPLPLESGSTGQGPAPAKGQPQAFDAGPAFKPSMAAEALTEGPTGFLSGTGASANPRPLAVMAKSATVVPMIKRRRRRTLVEEIRHAIFVNKNWIMLLLGLVAAIILASYVTSYFARQFDANVKDHYEPKDEERRTYMQSAPGQTAPGHPKK